MRTPQNTNSITAIHRQGKNYPNWLNDLCDPPKILYIYGNIALLPQPMITIIGSWTANKRGIDFVYPLKERSILPTRLPKEGYWCLNPPRQTLSLSKALLFNYCSCIGSACHWGGAISGPSLPPNCCTAWKAFLPCLSRLKTLSTGVVTALFGRGYSLWSPWEKLSKISLRDQKPYSKPLEWLF